MKTLFISILAATSVLVALMPYVSSRSNTSVRNGFDRNFIERAPKLERMTDLKSKRYYIAGHSGGKIFLGKSIAPSQLYAVSDSIDEVVQLIGVDSSFHESIIAIDSPYFFLSDPHRNTLLRGMTDSWNVVDTVSVNEFYLDFLPTGTSSIVYRTFSADSSQFELARQIEYNSGFIRAPGLLQKQIDGLFCTDGILLFDRASRTVVYVYFYRNEFVCADRELNLLYRGKTVDTVTTAKIRVSGEWTEGLSMLASPPRFVNRSAATSGGFLFVNSALMADNESAVDFEDNDVIDVYELATGKYWHSFYLPRPGAARARQFSVVRNKIHVLNGQYLSIYKMELPGASIPLHLPDPVSPLP